MKDIEKLLDYFRYNVGTSAEWPHTAGQQSLSVPRAARPMQIGEIIRNIVEGYDNNYKHINAEKKGGGQ